MGRIRSALIVGLTLLALACGPRDLDASSPGHAGPSRETARVSASVNPIDTIVQGVMQDVETGEIPSAGVSERSGVKMYGSSRDATVTYVAPGGNSYGPFKGNFTFNIYDYPPNVDKPLSEISLSDFGPEDEFGMSFNRTDGDFANLYLDSMNHFDEGDSFTAGMFGATSLDGGDPVDVTNAAPIVKFFLESAADAYR